MKDLEGQLAAGITGRDNEIKYLEDSKLKFEADFADYADAIDMLQKANAKLKEAHESADSAGFTNFLEINQLNFDTFAIMMEKKVSKLS